MAKKQPFASVCKEILDIVEGQDKAKRRLLREYHAIENSDGSRLLVIEEDEQVIVPASIDALISDILYLSHNVKSIKALTYTEAKQAAHFCFAGMAPIEDLVRPFCFQSTKGLTWHRIPFDIGYNDDCPLFDELMSRTSNADAMMAFIGSLFELYSDRSQYLWYYGAGRNGKSALLRLIAKIFGPAFTSDEVPKNQNRFWTHGLLNKRVVGFPDCEDPEFPMSGLFKKLTGGDSIRIEPKGKPAYNAPLFAKFIFLSNDMPIIDAKKADLSRVIFCEVGPLNGPIDPSYEKKLWDEAPGIVWRCLEKFVDIVVAGPGPTIPVNNDSYTGITSVNEDTMQAIFDQNFDYTFKPNLAPKNQDFVTGSEMQQILAKCNLLKNKADKGRFLTWISQTYSVKSQVFKDEKNRPKRGYVGIKPKWYHTLRTSESGSNVIDLSIKSE